jgi:hypothetical protein
MSTRTQNVVHTQEDRYEDHAFLPAGAGDRRARVLKELPTDREGAAKISTNVWDYIATLLRRTSKYPNALEDFFSPTIKSFKFSRDYHAGGVKQTYLVWREDNEVLVRYMHIRVMT